MERKVTCSGRMTPIILNVQKYFDVLLHQKRPVIIEYFDSLSTGSGAPITH